MAIPDEPDAVLSSAEIALQLVHSHASQRAKRKPSVLVQALGSVDRALQTAPGWPRALAVKGALLSQKSSTETSAVQANAVDANALEFLHAAVAGNPLLTRKYGKLIEELEQRLGKRPSAQTMR